MCQRPTEGHRRGPTRVVAFVRRRRWWLICLVALVGLPFADLPWMMDDHLHLNMLRAWVRGHADAGGFAGPFGELNLFRFGGSGDQDSAARLRAMGHVPWWTVDSLKLVFWRPLTSWLALAEYRLWPGQAKIAHFHSLLWYGGAAWAGLRLIQVVLSDHGPAARSLATLSTAVFILDGGHAFLLAWVANRNALVATTFAFLAVEFYVRSSRSGASMHRWISVAACLAALAGGEIALSGLALMPGHLLWADRRPWSRRLRDIAPQALIVLVWLVHYGVRSFGAHASGFYLSPFSEPGLFLAAAPGRALILVGDLIGPLPADIASGPDSHSIGLLQGLLAIIVLAPVLRWLRARIGPNERRGLYGLLGGAGLGLLPLLATEPSGRLLLAPSLARALLIALLLRSCWRARETSRWLRLASWLGLVRHLIAAPLLFLAMANLLGAGLPGLDAQARKVDWQGSAPPRFLINASDPSLAMLHHLAHRRMPELRRPPKWHLLASVSDDLVWRRSGDRSLELQHPNGASLISAMLGTLFRGHRPSLQPDLGPGQRLMLGDFTVTVLELDHSGRQPSMIRLGFPSSQALDAAKFYHWQNRALRELRPPEDGNWHPLPWAAGPLQR